MTTPRTTKSVSISDEAAARKRLRFKLMWRLMPFLLVCYLVNYLDRNNMSLAAANGMNDDLGLTATTYGLASGLFFVGYVLLELPSNMALNRFGARRWLARIMVTWGIVAAAIAFVPNEPSLYALRILLGIAEAGFTPGILFYLSRWFSVRDRGQANAIFLLGVPLSSVIGAPLMSGLIAGGDGVLFGLPGWRFMIFVTAIPAVILGVMCWFLLKDRPADAKWLSTAELQLLEAEIHDDKPASEGNPLRQLKNPRVWVMGLGCFGLFFALYALAFFLPTMIAGFEQQFHVSYSIIQIGLLTAVPYSFAVIAQLAASAIARRRNDVTIPIAVGTVVAAVGIVVAVSAQNPFVTMIGISFLAMGICSAIPLFLSLPGRFTVGAAMAAAVAIANSIGNLGSFSGPYFFGALKDATGTTSVALLIIAALLLVSGSIALSTRRWRVRRAADESIAPSTL